MYGNNRFFWHGKDAQSRVLQAAVLATLGHQRSEERDGNLSQSLSLIPSPIFKFATPPKHLI